jgi:hypothetical protein
MTMASDVPRREKQENNRCMAIQSKTNRGSTLRPRPIDTGEEARSKVSVFLSRSAKDDGHSDRHSHVAESSRSEICGAKR